MNLAEAMAIGRTVVESRLFPAEIKTAEQAAIIILTGAELGIPPMAALRSVQVVRGKMSEAADSQLARFKSQGGRAVVVEHTDEVCVLRMTHPNGDEYTSSFSIADARRAQLNSPIWKTHPRAMLRSRAITAGLKSLGWSGAAGVYDPDETREIVAQHPSVDSAPTAPASDDTRTPAASGPLRPLLRVPAAPQVELDQPQVVEREPGDDSDDDERIDPQDGMLKLTDEGTPHGGVTVEKVSKKKTKAGKSFWIAKTPLGEYATFSSTQAEMLETAVAEGRFVAMGHSEVSGQTFRRIDKLELLERVSGVA